jgi:hypothetical protein
MEDRVNFPTLAAAGMLSKRFIHSSAASSAAQSSAVGNLEVANRCYLGNDCLKQVDMLRNQDQSI